MIFNHVIHQLIVLLMVSGEVGVTIQHVLPHVVLVPKHELVFVSIKQMEDNHVMVHQRKQFHVIQLFLVQV